MPPLMRPASILIAVASVLFGGLALCLDLAVAFRDAPKSVFSRDFLAQRSTVTRTVPAGESLLHISAEPETWNSRLWQRSLFPRNPTIIVQPPFGSREIRALQNKYAARHAISAGNPPFDPGYRWRVTFAPPHGQSGEVWFGELMP